MPQLIFIDVPPLFQKHYASFFEEWSYSSIGPTRYLDLDTGREAMAPHRSQYVILFERACHPDSITYMPRSQKDAELLVDWERKHFIWIERGPGAYHTGPESTFA